MQTQAFEAINEVVRASAADTTPMVVQLIPLVVGKLQETLHMNTAGSAEAAERQSEIQVCGQGWGGWSMADRGSRLPSAPAGRRTGMWLQLPWLRFRPPPFERRHAELGARPPPCLLCRACCAA